MRFASWLAVVLSILLMAWLASRSDQVVAGLQFGGQKTDYYNLLVDGFQEGHLYMKAEVHPGRLSPDIEVRKRSPYLLDASEYQGRHYLYFGVVPAVFAFWPYAALTGHDLPEQVAVLLAIAGAFVISVRLYLAARRRYFPEVPAWIDGLNVLLLGFATGYPCLLRMGGMYEVAIAYGLLCAALMWHALFHAWHSPRPLRWLAWASLAFGLSVGCRPTCFLLGPLLPLTGFLLWRRRTGPNSLPAGRLALAVFIPAACIGAGLMAYNQARFGSPFEFGLSYQVNPVPASKTFGLAFIPVNLGWYYLSVPSFSPFFPFLFPIDTSNVPPNYFGWEPVHGQWIVTLLAVAVLTTFLGRLRQESRNAIRDLLPFAGTLALGFVIMALATSSFGVRSNRYLTDFHAALITLLVLLAGWGFARPGRALRRLARWIFGCLGLAAVAANVLASIQLLDLFRHTRPETYAALANYADLPAGWLTQAGALPYGPVRFKVRFNRPEHPVLSPVVTTGTPGYRDILQVGLYPNGYMDFILFHENIGGARTILLPVEWNHTYDIELDMGSLYPPANEAFTRFWAGRPREQLKSFGRVTIDGAEVIRTRQAFHDSPPYRLDFGRVPGRVEARLNGEFPQVVRLPPRDRQALLALSESGLWRLELEIPAILSAANQPLLSSGRAGAGNLLFLQSVSETEFRFALDCWSLGLDTSPALPRLTGTRQQVEVFVGAQALQRFPERASGLDPAKRDRVQRTVCIWIDGKLAWKTNLRGYLDTFDVVGIGTNTQGFSTAQATYAGHFRQLRLSDSELRMLADRGFEEALSGR